MQLKRLLFFVIIVLVGIQFISTQKNQSTKLLETDISKSFDMPTDIQKIFKTTCYDCHSNNTNYPWYNKIQPIGYLLERHIKNGKKELNFNEFGEYSLRKQKSKIKAIKNQVIGNKMPLWSYTLIHKNSKLSQQQKDLIKQWASKLLDSLN
ncbi:MAG: heme-binding domain-containing protein [Flavobacteriia bacterium]|nr:heme-binding domain-containing protein [Flavobacteriia bacterium]